MTLRFRFQCHHQFPREGRPMAAGRGHAATVPWILVAKWTRMEIGNRWWWTHQTLDWFKGKSTGKTKPIFGGKKNMVSGFKFPLNQPIESNILKFHPTNMSFFLKKKQMFISFHIPDLKNHISYTLLFAIHYSAGSTGFLHISLCYMFCVLSYSFYCMNFIILYCIVIYCILYYLHYIHII